MEGDSPKIKKIYQDIQKDLFYMIPEKWDKVYLYASIIDRLGNLQTGEMFFYYSPKGLLKKNPVNVYEIPNKFNIDESSYLKLVEILYEKIKELRREFKKEKLKLWSNITISIENFKFKIEYKYENIATLKYSSYENHIIWRYKYLGIGMNLCNKKEKQILKKYFESEPKEVKTEVYEEAIYRKPIRNIVDYDTEEYDSTQNVEYVASKNDTKNKNQILNFKN